jgi:hypothetical protein
VDRSTFTEISETLKDIKLLTINGNATLHRFLELMERHSIDTTQLKLKGVKINRDQKSTIKKGKLGSQQKLQVRINIKIKEFDQVKKSLEMHMLLPRPKSRVK